MSEESLSRPSRSPSNANTDDTIPIERTLHFDFGQRVLGRYVLESVLGQGGMAVVWRARDENLGETVALKFLPEVVARDAVAVEELKEETRRARRLTHPNIVRIHDFVQDAAMAAVSMEYVDGDTLANLRLAQPGKIFSVATLAPLVAQLCAALEYAHTKAKLVHRDIKPANLLVTREGQLKVTDFGIARGLTEASVRLTNKTAGRTSGTILYASPQQLMGEKPTEADDIYALGATLYELLTGKPPFFRGDAHSLVMQVRDRAPIALADRRTELEVTGTAIPAAWETTILACLAKPAEERPKSMREVAERFEFATGVPGSEAADGKQPAGHTFSKSEGDRKPRGKALMVVGGVVAAVVGVLGYIFWPIKPLAIEKAPSRAAAAAGTAEALAAEREIVITIDPPDAESRVSVGPNSDVPVKNGKIAFNNLADGEHELTVKAAGFRDFERRVTVKAGREEVNVRLLKARAPLASQASGATPEKQRTPEVGQRWTIPDLNLELVPIAPGTFTMGSPESEEGRDANEGPQTQVTITQPFWLGKTEVTQREWQAMMGNNPSNFKGENFPVEKVSWTDVMEFCRKLTERERAAGRLPERYVYTLPTEAQWEYACRAGTTGEYAGDLSVMGWYKKKSGGKGTSAVSTRRPNAWGLFDMHGNVSEWCVDWYGDKLPGGNVRDPEGPPAGIKHVNRGGEWNGSSRLSRSAFRFGSTPDRRSLNLGFRLALAPASVRVPTDMAAAQKPPAKSGKNETTAAKKRKKAAVPAETPVTKQSAANSATVRASGAVPVAGQPWTIPDLGLMLVPIAPGTFTMGSPKSEAERGANERPQTQVTITKAFWLGKTEVTQAQWQALMDENPSEFKGGDRPVDRTTWSESMAYCRKLTERERVAGRLLEGYAYTLPTEAQWEYACRAGGTVEFKTKVEEYAWYRTNSEQQTHPVGQKRANAWGLHDMLGNVGEWCLDWYADKLPGGSVREPIGPSSGSGRVRRGGNFGSTRPHVRFAARGPGGEKRRYSGLGFRVALVPVVTADAADASGLLRIEPFVIVTGESQAPGIE